MKLVSADTQKVDLQITGPRYIIGSLDNDDIIVTAITSGVLQSGTYSLDLKAELASGVPSDVTIHSLSTSKVVAKFDTFTEQSYSITAVPQNVVAAEGHALGLETLSADRVKVYGPYSEIQKIKTAVARYSAPSGNKVSQNFTSKAEIHLLDGEGNEIDMTAVKMDPTSVDISVPVLKTKKLPITLEFINAPDGFAENNQYYKIQPGEIEIAGPTDVIDTMSSFRLGTLDLSKYLESKTVTYQITAQEGTQIISKITEAEVTLDYSKIKNKKINILNFQVEGVPQGFTANVITTRLENVTVLSPASTIKSITESDLVAVVNLSDRQLSPGQMEVSVSIKSKKGRMVWAYGNYTVLVNVQQNPDAQQNISSE